MAWLNNTERNAIMKATTNVKLAAIILAAGLAGCASGPGYHARQGCAEPNYAGAVIGGLAGGLLGAQVGSGSGRTAATAIGAGTGAVIGSQVNCQ
jgi:outer membrane lipoprotein SlyB